ncbi:MAG: amidohydrolase [Desulfobacterales bacterium]|nr:amidohydrolase [Desulfobacterales bacterium]
MIIDFHTHIFPSEICKNREKYFYLEPAFELLYRSPKAKMIDDKKIINIMDDDKVNRSVIFGFPWKNADLFKKHNDYIMEAVNRHPGRFIGFCCFDPMSKEAVPEILRCLGDGIAGLGELAFYDSDIDEANLEKLAPIMEISRENDLPILMHTNEPIGHMYPGKTAITLNQIYHLVKKFSKNKIILAHWGGGLFFFQLLKKEVKKMCENVYFDTAASPFLYDPKVYEIAIRIIGEEKILFGSDFPLIRPARYIKELENTNLTREQIRNIFGLNAARLLKLI